MQFLSDYHKVSSCNANRCQKLKLSDGIYRLFPTRWENDLEIEIYKYMFVFLRIELKCLLVFVRALLF